jgi:hypothetical protein
VEDEQAVPAQPRKKSRTPNLDRWHAEQLRPDPKDSEP